MGNTALETYAKATADDAVVHISEAAKEENERKSNTNSFSTGFEAIDKVFNGGIRGGELTLLTGKSGNGKSLLGVNVCVNMSRNLIPSMYFSYECSISNLYRRFCKIGEGNKEHFLVYTAKRNTTGNLKWVKEKICEGIKKFKVFPVVVDYLEALSPTNSRTNDQYRIYLQNITQELKDFAVDKDIPILLNCHVRKIPDDKEVEMQDIGESSGIYKVADNIIAINRHWEEVITEFNGKKIKQKVYSNTGTIKTLKTREGSGQAICYFKVKDFRIIVEKDIVLGEGTEDILNNMLKQQEAEIDYKLDEVYSRAPKVPKFTIK